ncbi:MAG TPA: tetratricopeptide repeat protein [Thermoanaerobaculia bacterium]
MNRRLLSALVAATLLSTACANTSTPPPVAAPTGEDRFLIDPRTGFAQPPAPGVERKFTNAWNAFLAGDNAEAHRLLADIETQDPEYLPATLADAAVQIREGSLDAARATVQHVEKKAPDYSAARVYEAEIAMAQHQTRAAYEIYHALSLTPNPPSTVAERLATLQTREFEELFTSAQSAPDEEAIRLLHEALLINPGSTSARVLLAQKLIARREFTEARAELDPLGNSADFDRPEVQEALAEVEAGQGQFQEAITRYERLQRGNPNPRYAQRLEQIKQQWNEANMPPEYQRAVESPAIDRADFAVLTYWKLNSVRFAQNLGAPPIAIDIEGVPGREEIIRAIAIGLYDVDPVTRRVSPLRPVTAAALSRLAARLLTIRGASCTRDVPYERDEALRAEKVLAACGISDPSASVPSDEPVTGRAAAAVLDAVDKALAH